MPGRTLALFARARAGSLADIAESLRGQLGPFQTGCEQAAHYVVGEELHPAVSVVNDKEFARPEQFVTDDERANGVVACASTSISNHVRPPW